MCVDACMHACTFLHASACNSMRLSVSCDDVQMPCPVLLVHASSWAHTQTPLCLAIVLSTAASGAPFSVHRLLNTVGAGNRADSASSCLPHWVQGAMPTWHVLRSAFQVAAPNAALQIIDAAIQAHGGAGVSQVRRCQSGQSGQSGQSVRCAGVSQVRSPSLLPLSNSD